jgi:hypothetical protein
VSTITALCPWFDTLGYALSLLRDGTLSVDEEGRIWRHREFGRDIESRRAENKSRKGYLRLTLGVPGTRRTATVQAHRVVWTWLRGPIPDGLQVNHKDLNKANNRPDNLELVTGSGNIRHSYANGRPRPWHKASEWRPGIPRIDGETISRIRGLHATGLGCRRISQVTGVSRTHVARLLKKGGER